MSRNGFRVVSEGCHRGLKQNARFVLNHIVAQNCEFSCPKCVLTTCFASYGFVEAVPRCPDRDGFRMVSERFERGFRGVSERSETFAVFRTLEMSI